jgi:hypothetical protein
MISASGWLFKKKSITMHGNMNVKYVNPFILVIICLHKGQFLLPYAHIFVQEILFKHFKSFWKKYSLGKYGPNLLDEIIVALSLKKHILYEPHILYK